MEQNITFGAIVKERRHYLGLTQAELARRVSCAAITIRKIEANALRPSVQIAEQLAIALNVPEAEQLAFVRLARADPEPSPLPAPEPASEEIGQADLTGRAVKGFELGQRLGTGGYGVVYRASQITVGRDVAIKIILPKYADRLDFIRRFETEAQLVARLEHPHIVPLYDYWREPGVAYLVMRLLPGGSLEDNLKNGPLAPENILHIFEQICAGLHTAHRAGVVHRDIKPANILLDQDGNAYLADFGIAKHTGNGKPAETTIEGTIVGSPAYISPEQILAEPVKPQTDIYSMGVMLYELLSGQKPFKGPTPFAYIQQHLNQPLPLLIEALQTSEISDKQPIPTTLDIVIARATAKEPHNRYLDIMSMLADMRRALEPGSTPTLLTDSQKTPDLPPHVAAMLELPDLENPYKGLRPFTEADAADFFGRETLVQDLLARLAEQNDLARFLAVVGPSGSGKSSVVRAGLTPAMRKGGLPGSENWFITEMLPGPHPFEELEAALLRVAVHPPKDLLSQLCDNERGLLRVVQQILPATYSGSEAADTSDTELVLVIDQFEELFTLVEDEATRHRFLDSLVAAVIDPVSQLRVVITLRADFIDHPLRYVDFGELVRQRAEFVLPLTPDELELAIVKPTQRAGLNLEAGLVSDIIRQIGNRPGALPLLQYALTELFERRQGRMLTLAAFQESGGVMGALARRADELYDGLDQAGQKITRQLFSRLVTLGEDMEDTRRRVVRSELSSLVTDHLSLVDGSTAISKEQVTNDKRLMTIDEVINQFGRYRLLTFDRDPVTRSPTVEVAHESLIREWGRLKRWLDEDREFLLWQQRLRAALHQWQASQEDEGALLRGAPLTEAETWTIQRKADLNEDERDFIKASLALREQRTAEREAQRQRELEAAQKLAATETRAAASLRKRAVWLTAAGIIALLLAIVAGIFGVQSRQNAQEAVTAQQAAEREARRAKSGQLALRAQAMLNNDDTTVGCLPSPTTTSQVSPCPTPEAKQDPSGSLALLLAREAVLTTLIPDGYFTVEADTVMRQAIEAVPPWRMTMSHPNVVNSVAFSPDGKRVITAGGDGFVRIWDTRLGEEIVSGFRHTPGAINSVAFSPDGKMVAMVGDGGYIELRDAILTDHIFHKLEGHTATVMWAAFSPDGKTLITTSQNPDSTARLWDVTNGREIRRFEGHEKSRWVTQAAFSPDGQWIVTSGGDQTARLWDISTGKEIQQFIGHTHIIDSATFSPDGKMIATASWDQTARLWDVKTGEDIRQFTGHTDVVHKVAFSPDGQTVVTASQDSTVRLWDVATGAEIGRLDGHTTTVNMAVFSPDGQTIATVSNDQTARLWNAVPNEQRHHFEHRGEVKSIAINPTGDTLVTTSNLPSGEALVWDMNSGKEIFRLEGHRGEVTAADISPDGQLIATAGSDKTIRLWKSATGEQIQIFEGHEDYIFDVTFGPNGESIVSASADKTARIWDIHTGKEITQLVGHAGQVRSATFSPDGVTVATAGGFQDKNARLWDVVTGKEIQQFNGHTDALNSVNFSPDGQTIVTAGGDSTVRLWNSSTGQQIRVIEGYEGGVYAATFSPDGQWLVTAGFDQTARVLDVANGQEIRRFEGHTGPVNAAIFSPDGQTVITASNDKTVRVWPSIEQLLVSAESLIQRTPPEFTPEERIRFGLSEN